MTSRITKECEPCEKSSRSSRKDEKAAAERAKSNPIKGCFDKLGPGLITGASDDDPSGIGTYAQCGAQFGTTFLWMSLITYPLMAAVQYICAKIALVTGRGLGGVLRKYYPKPLVFCSVALLVVANTINVGADLGAVAAGINLMVPALKQEWLIVPIAILIMAVQLLGSYKLIANTFKWLTLALFSYICTAFFVHIDFRDVATHTFIPHMKFDKDSISMAVALLGTTISPYLFFWQASQEVEEAECKGSKEIHKHGASSEVLNDASFDVNAGMLVSNLVMFFIIMVSAATLHTSGKINIESAAQAAEALRPLAGQFASALFALGLIGTGILAIPVLTGSSGFALAESLGIRFSLNKKFSDAKLVYGVMIASMVIGAALNYIGINAMKMLFITAIINGVLAPPLLLLIMLIANNKNIMGEHTNRSGTNILGWLCTLFMFIAAGALLITLK